MTRARRIPHSFRKTRRYRVRHKGQDTWFGHTAWRKQTAFLASREASTPAECAAYLRRTRLLGDRVLGRCSRRAPR